MPYQAFITSLCYKDSLDWSGWVSWFFYTTPITLWWLLAGLAFYTKDCYVQLLSSSYWITAVTNIILQELIQERHPNVVCNNSGWGNPSFESQLAYHFMIMMLIHRLYWIGAVGILDVFRGFLLVVVVPIVLVVSGNYSIVQVLIGAIVGALTGLFASQAIYLFWIDRLKIIATHPIFVRWGYRDVSTFYTNGAPVSPPPPPPLPSEMSDSTTINTIPDQESAFHLLDPFLTEMKPSELSSRLKYPIRRPLPIIGQELSQLISAALMGGGTFEFQNWKHAANN